MATSSLDSSRPMLASYPPAPSRISTYSQTPTLTPSVAPSHISRAASTATTSTSLDPNDSRTADITHYASSLARMTDQRLQSQRFVVSERKREEQMSLALGAKLERALGRRMSGQDAVFRKKLVKPMPVGGTEKVGKVAT